MFTALRRPEKLKVYFKRLIEEIESIGINSLGIVCIVSVFMGAVLTLQVAINFTSPLIPRYLIGLSARDTFILEFSSTVVCLILSGKVGSNIASEIGTMRITEQIDALDMMGINSANYLITPKILAAIISFPFLNLLSIFLGIIGGYIIAILTDVVTVQDYVVGLHYMFIPYYIVYSLIKMVFFAVIISSISAYHGYYTSGGALEVGRSSTHAVVYSIIVVLLFNLILTQLLLT
ncbi:MAG TPA: ABC transporter permease [Bacteroidales bacterium]|jgi:phospholipid/cholesterol/gamma-HCH transport system permease protein|nr:ABC transporter permease [Bacteroidales bacterium]MDD4234883.1 ABC transporter permease [Bacteroidales bacterium]MDY0161310.1 ABC transporter permease [Bacteroidales bacterium]HXK82031.1 ABC transporter permease [Bacteroidales bacterium]